MRSVHAGVRCRHVVHEDVWLPVAVGVEVGGGVVVDLDLGRAQARVAGAEAGVA